MGQDRRLLLRFREAGRWLYELGLVDSHSGNLSERLGEALAITRTGASLRELAPGDLVLLPLKGGGLAERRASRELIVHRAVYRAFPEVRAIAHAHPPFAVLLSLARTTIVPLDSEGKSLLGEVPVLEAFPPSQSPEAAARVVEGLKGARVMVLKGHGAFARAQTLEEAVFLLSALEGSSRLIFHHRA